MDSHPARTNGFLTGCLVQSISNQSALSIDELSRLVQFNKINLYQLKKYGYY